jgi:hypothetical protein
MMEALGPSETSVLTRATRRNIPEEAILQMFENVPQFKYWGITVINHNLIQKEIKRD